MRKHTQMLFSAATVLWICCIWGHSLVPASISSRESGVTLALVVKLLRQLGINFQLTDHLVRKSAHFLEYMILGILLSGTLSGWRETQRKRVYGFLELIFCIPFLDETVQLFVPGRSGMISDVWLDIAGGTMGAGIFILTQTVILHNGSERLRQSAKESGKQVKIAHLPKKKLA